MAREFVHGQDSKELRKRKVTLVTRRNDHKLLIINYLV